MEEIKNQIEYTVYWIRVDQKKMYVLAKGFDYEYSKKELEKILDRIEYSLICNLVINLDQNEYGIISIKIRNYQVLNKKLNKIRRKNKEGVIWFDKDWLFKNKWNKKYISNILHLIRKNKCKILKRKINYYHLLVN